MKRIKELYQSFSHITNQLVRILCIAFFSVMVLTVLTSVVMRYVIVRSMVWGEQLAVYCMIWIGFLSASIGFRKGAHMGLDLLVIHLPKRLQQLVLAIAHLMIILFLGILIYWGIKHAYAVRFQTSPVLGNISISWAYLALPVGGIFMLIQELNVVMHGVEEDV